MDYDSLSPKYTMELIPKIAEALWSLFTNSKYQNVRRYVEKWHSGEWTGWNGEEWSENFHIHFKDEETKREIDLDETLHGMPADILIKIAIDLGIDTPGFLPAIPTFKNVLKDQNQSAYQNFMRASKSVSADPDNAVALASSTLEGIAKTILEHEVFADSRDKLKNLSLTRLIIEIVKKFKLEDKDAPAEIFSLAKQLRGIGSTLDDLRSDKTTAHGKGSKDYVIDDPLWATFSVNIVTSLGLFMWEYFNKKFIPEYKKRESEIDIDDKPIDLSEIPF